ncbi:MAG TPA: methyltransferase [Croceibacterium sp.]|nr:methyltransferase [Croceibacterium sp.]
MTDRADGDYWTRYYRRRETPILPSQFAAFVANELLTGQLPEIGAVVDLGCGNGRDSFFFLQFGRPVHAVDASEAAIAGCGEQLARKPDGERRLARFTLGRADDEPIWSELARATSGAPLIYARFFFHAIDEQAQARVLDRAAALLHARGGVLCVEARTDRDARAAKVTPEHYRRFIRPDDFAAALEQRGLHLCYRAEGTGMAKYREDDAHVFRMIAAP